jgi:hypothetical protein
MIPRSAEELFDPDYTPDESATEPRRRTGDVRTLHKQAERDKIEEFTDEADLREVLAIPSGAGIRFIARLIAGPCGWNTPYFHPSNSVMCETAGRRSIGYQLEQWICNADPELWAAVRAELEKTRPKPKTSQRK